ncbi:MAG: hypothetical protein NZ951_02330 [Dehalococcoidia bacterium]|nr:hypothetical protein [Dehalococcoidia bacterium]MDW8119797.1 hypothetical protein [Chloroflexota bacterium]
MSRWASLLGVALALGVAVGLDLWVRAGKYATWWGRMPGVYALLGLFGSIGMVWLCKTVAHRWLERPLSYYGDDREAHEDE